MEVTPQLKTYYCYSADNVTFEGRFDCIEDAKLAFILKEQPKQEMIYYIGEVVEYNPRDFISVLNLVSEINAQAVFEVGADKVGTWPELSQSKYHELREMLAKFFEQYYPVPFTGVQNVKRHIIGE